MEKLSSHVVRTCDVIGKKIIGTNEETLGSVNEIVLDKINGQVRYAVLSYGGFMGVWSEFYAIPWTALNYCIEDDSFKVSFGKEDLKVAPGFNKDNWPDFADAIWSKSTSDFYNHFIHPTSPMVNEQKEFISESGNSQKLKNPDL